MQVVRMNISLPNNSVQCRRDTSVTSVVFPCLYSLLFLCALVLNSLAAWIFFKIPSTSTFVVYLKNVVRKNLRIRSPGCDMGLIVRVRFLTRRCALVSRTQVLN